MSKRLCLDNNGHQSFHVVWWPHVMVHAAIAAAKQDPPKITVASNHVAGAIESEPLAKMTETERAK